PWLRCGARRARGCERLLRPDPADAVSDLDERQGPQRRGATMTEDRLSSLLLAWRRSTPGPSQAEGSAQAHTTSCLPPSLSWSPPSPGPCCGRRGSDALLRRARSSRSTAVPATGGACPVP